MKARRAAGSSPAGTAGACGVSMAYPFFNSFPGIILRPGAGLVRLGYTAWKGRARPRSPGDAPAPKTETRNGRSSTRGHGPLAQRAGRARLAVAVGARPVAPASPRPRLGHAGRGTGRNHLQPADHRF